ncbi:MAG: InlB B-repeat-containing protein [Bacteroidales bacterium]|nr:InlB B-repeat-containing protein [Bacteroidales bacterium]
MKTFYTFQNFIASCIVLCFSIQLFAIHQIDGNWEEYGLTEEYDGYYVIATAEDLYEFQGIARNKTFNAVLIADIVLNESVLDENGDLRSDYETAGLQEWTPISYFSGTFDGNNHSIRGLYIVNETNSAAFFSNVRNLVVKNLIMHDCYLEGGNQVGVLVDYVRSSSSISIFNCQIEGKVDGNSYVGGFIGYADGIIDIQQSVNKINVYAADCAGGFCGYITPKNVQIKQCVNYGNVFGEDIGGIIGSISGSSDVNEPTINIVDCVNKGTMTSVSYAGGICGGAYSAYTRIKGCHNQGKIQNDFMSGGIVARGCGVIEQCSNSANVSATNYAGGIVAMADNNKSLTILNCENTGIIYGGSIGGIVGVLSGGVTIQFCLNVGEIRAISNSGKSIAYGNASNVTIENCYYDNQTSICDDSYATGMTTEELCNGTLPANFDSEIWIAGNANNSTEVISEDNVFGYSIKSEYPRLQAIDEHTYVKQSYYNFSEEGVVWEEYTPIYTQSELISINDGVAANYVLMKDITLDGTWTPLNEFSGKLSGNGKSISNININSNGNYVGLFSKITSTGLVMNLTMAEGSITGYQYVGAICGSSAGTIRNCDNYASVAATNGKVGGICGIISGNAKILRCRNYATISGEFTGGICGLAESFNCIMQECYNKGTIVKGGGKGGILGQGPANIKYCFNAGMVDGEKGYHVGGISGWATNSASQCLNISSVSGYANVGSVIGEGSSIYCYYNSEKSSAKGNNGKDYKDVAEPKTTRELCDSVLPNGFSSDYWAIKPFVYEKVNGSLCKTVFYPYIKAFGEESAIEGLHIPCHTITLNFNGGSTSDSVYAFYVEGESVPLPEHVVKDGCTFDGWYDNSNYSSDRYTCVPNTSVGFKNFYAKWIANNYTITYELDGGTVNSGKNTTYTYGYGVMLPTDVTKNGYTFKGWYDNPRFEGESVLAIPANATGNKTYYANWVVNTYNVTFFTYEGIMDTDIDSYTFGKETVLPTDVTKSGYDFGGWYTNDSYSGVAIQSIASNETGDKMYYAKWNKKSYPVSVTFDRAMGSISGIDSYLHGDNAVLKAHADAGYEFAFWSCADETVLEDKNARDSTLMFVVTSPTELSATFKFKEIVYPAAEFVIGMLKTETEIAPIDLATLFESSEGGEISYMVTSSSPNVLLPQIEDGKLYLSTMGLQGKATITVTAKLANGNKSSLSAEAVVEYNCNIQVEPTIVNASCYGFSDGSISLAVENEYAYQWIGEDVTTNKIENVKAGNYSVQITDERGCKSLETYTVSQPDEISVEIAEVVNPRCGVQSEIHLNAAGDYTYAWSNGSTGKDLVGAEIGDYSVVVTNPETGCSTTLTQSLELTFQKPQISLVTVSKETGKNLIVWVRENTDQIAYYTIYREGAQSKKYTAIGTVNYSEISVFQDDVAKPMTRQWSYKISATDVCGHETELSEAHTTLHLNEMESMHDGMAELIWQPYEGLDYNSFYIVRETKVNNYTFIDTVTTVPSTLTSYTAEIPPLGKSIFYVGVKLDKVIDPKQFMKAESGPFALALSNIAEVENMGNPDAVETMENAVEISVISHTIFVKNAANKTIEVYEIGGRKIATVNGLETNTIDVVHDGVYFVVVDGKATKVLVK